ncbi:unnamed protein product, partial [Mesorhabditis spiculigera]
MATWGISLCSILGSLSLLLNLFVVAALLKNRRRVLKNVFYVIVLHCAILDVIRGICLVLHGVPVMLSPYFSIGNKILLLKMNRHTLVVLRACNLLTIFNLLVFTTNEFVVVRYPLHYRRYIRRRTAILVIIVCWFVSIFFGIASAISAPITKNENSIFAKIQISTIAQVTAITLCYVCLAIVLICYGKILRTIREFHGLDGKNEAFGGEESKKIMRNGSFREMLTSGEPSYCTTRSDCSSRVDSGRRTRSPTVSRHKYLLVIGSVLFVDVLFLFPYSGIQLVSFLHLHKLIGLSQVSNLARWGFQILIGVHAVCQPLCYFRMTEFRRIACCNPRKRFLGSKSISQHKSFANTRSRDFDGGDHSFVSDRRYSTTTMKWPNSKSSESMAIHLRTNLLCVERRYSIRSPTGSSENISLTCLNAGETSILKNGYAVPANL